MDKKQNAEQLAELLYAQALIKCPPPQGVAALSFKQQRPNVQQAFILKAKEMIRQIEGGMDEVRDASAMRERVVKAVKKLDNDLLLSSNDIDFMTAVVTKAGETLPTHTVMMHLDADKLMFMYYAGLSVDQAVTMFNSYLENLIDKMGQLKANKGDKHG